MTAGARQEPLDILAIGEALIDMLPTATSSISEPEFSAVMGGAPANVVVAMSALGYRAGLATRVGDDWFGEQVIATLGGHGVDLRLVRKDSAHHTSVSIVRRPDQEGPSFLMYRSDTADANMLPDEAMVAEVRQARLVHLSSLLRASAAGRRTWDAAVSAARSSGVPISTDLNLRPSAYSSTRDMIDAARVGFETADVVKATAEELSILGIGASELISKVGVVLVTDSGATARLVSGSVDIRLVPPRVIAVDPTGAGDASLAGLLHVLVGAGYRPGTVLTEDLATAALAAAVAAGSRAVQHRGAAPPPGWSPGRGTSSVGREAVT